MCCHWGLAVLAVLSLNIQGLPCRSYVIRSGDTLWSFFHDAERAEFVARLNGLEPRELQPKRVIDIPADWSAYRWFSPLPKNLPDQKSADHLTVVDLTQQFLGTYENGRLIWWCRVSPGTDENPTAVGTYRIQWKDIDHVSNLYFDDRGQGRPMCYGVNIGGELWIHEGFLPGYPASHGCIRLRKTDAKHYYEWARVGSTVIVR